eukprot:scaffold13607_cov35-Tisochrysis_lutea.AAC.2
MDTGWLVGTALNNQNRVLRPASRARALLLLPSSCSAALVSHRLPPTSGASPTVTATARMPHWRV